MIKKYDNRKLYSTELKKYITLTHVLDAVKAGENVQVVTHNGGKDITEETIREAILRSSDVSTEQLMGLLCGR